MHDKTAKIPIRGASRHGIDISGGIPVAGHQAPRYTAHIAFLACMMLAGCAAMTNTGAGSEAGRMDTTAARMQARTGAESHAIRRGGAMKHVRGVVQQIEWIPAQQADIAVSGATGAVAIGGSVADGGSPAGFRVTLRTDDGSLQSVMVGMQPECNVGDRVTYSDGIVAR
ncbi:MAG TPA: hypothetical protein VF774_24200 [Pseudoduganella sp.]|jgi:hypothetical protein